MAGSLQPFAGCLASFAMPQAVRELNLYREGDTTHFGQVLDACRIRNCWEQVKSSGDLATRQQVRVCAGVTAV